MSPVTENQTNGDNNLNVSNWCLDNFNGQSSKSKYMNMTDPQLMCRKNPRALDLSYTVQHCCRHVKTCLCHMRRTKAQISLRICGGCCCGVRINSFRCSLQMSPVTRKPAFGIFDQVRLKPACSADETS